MLNIVIPMAGRGNRFREAGYTIPKPLIPVHGKPMIQVVINNLRPKCEHRFIFICLKEHIENSNVDKLLKDCVSGCEVVVVDAVTEGPACTVLLAKKLIDNNNSLMIANCDQYVEIDIDRYLEEMDKINANGLIMTFFSAHPKWSYVRLDQNSFVTEVAEKQVISNNATVGIYNFRRGSDFVKATEMMIASNLRINNEFYVAPVYNQIIGWGGKVVIYDVGRENDGMYGLGTPKDFEFFLSTNVSLKAAS